MLDPIVWLALKQQNCYYTTYSLALLSNKGNNFFLILQWTILYIQNNQTSYKV